MPKTNKHVEVKPSKFRTALCEFYLRQEECPFGSRCAFAHGEHELQTEQRNLEILKVTGLNRLDGAVFSPHPPISCSAMTTESSLSVLFPITTSFRRHPVLVSLPSWTDSRSTGSDQDEPTSPVSQMRGADTTSLSSIPTKDRRRARCSSRFSATCSTEAPVMYRHNPYGLSTQYE